MPLDTADSLPGWQDVAENLPGALMSVWGTAASDVYVVGADVGAGPMAYHLSGNEWSAVDGLSPGDVWWVSGDEERVWMAGAGGRVFRQDRASGMLDAWQLDEVSTFFGIWGPGDGTAVAVGGNPELPNNAAVLFTFDGAQWSQVELPPEVAEQYALYKVWGKAGSDAWAVGTGGVSLHFDGATWTYVDTVSYVNLFTVHDGYAVGGDIGGTILSLSTAGMVWADESPDFAVQITGVHGGENAVAVGVRGSVWHRGGTAWEPDPRALPTYQDLHCAWVDPDGGVWAAGGHVSGAPLIQGALVYGGRATIPGLE